MSYWVARRHRYLTSSLSRFPTYQLVSLHLLPKVHEEINLLALADSSTKIMQRTAANASHEQCRTFHVLFSSHHLISPNKRKSLQQWSSSLCLTGFAKVGYPGVIYAQGERSCVEEFVDNVKAMQWLALKVRFVEPLDTEHLPSKSISESKGEARKWKEFQKVGEVVEEMRKLGREEYVVEMGIGSAGINAKSSGWYSSYPQSLRSLIPPIYFQFLSDGS